MYQPILPTPADFRQGRGVFFAQGRQRIEETTDGGALHLVNPQSVVVFWVHYNELRMERIQARHSLLSQFGVVFWSVVHTRPSLAQPLDELDSPVVQ